VNINELRQRVSQLPSPLPDAGRWQYHAGILRQNILELDPSEFLTWPVVVSTMFVGDGSQLREEYTELRKCSNWFNYERAAREDHVGNPPISELAPGMNSNLLHQVYHLSRWEVSTGRRIKDLTSIVEVGGGYGAFAKVCRQLGFGGSYTLIDLPEFIALQEYYLSQTCGTQRIDFVSDPKQLPTWTDLLVANYSLSEMTPEERQPILNHVRTDNYLLAFQETYDGINNDDYFANIPVNQSMAWRWMKAACMPTCHYLIGALDFPEIL
jgi:hypothetical protein